MFLVCPATMLILGRADTVTQFLVGSTLVFGWTKLTTRYTLRSANVMVQVANDLGFALYVEWKAFRFTPMIILFAGEGLTMGDVTTDLVQLC